MSAVAPTPWPPLLRKGLGAERGVGAPPRHWKCRAHERKSAEADWRPPYASRLQPASVAETGTSSVGSVGAALPCPLLNDRGEGGRGDRGPLPTITRPRPRSRALRPEGHPPHVRPPPPRRPVPRHALVQIARSRPRRPPRWRPATPHRTRRDPEDRRRGPKDVPRARRERVEATGRGLRPGRRRGAR